MKIALVAIAKNEDHYINEWIRYNLKLGFTKIFIYQNDWIAKIDPDIDMSKIELIDWPSNYINEKLDPNIQINAYNDFIAKKYLDFNWAAFFDCDEFLYMNKVKDLQTLLEMHCNDKSIQIDWRLFGDNGHTKVENGNYSVIDRFIMSAKMPFGRGKSMINFNLAKNELQSNGHETLPIKPIKIDSSDAEIAHYMCKSWEEFLNRRQDSKNFFYSNYINQKNIEVLKHFFDGKNKNEIKNTKVYDFFHKNNEIISMRSKVGENGLHQLLDNINKNNLVLIEIGSYTGESAKIFAASNKFKTIICIDPWENGYDDNDLASSSNMKLVEQKFDETISSFNNILKFKGKLKDFIESPLFKEYYAKIDLVYIDANHTYDGCKNDIQLCQKHLKPNIAYAGHDYNVKKYPGVKQAVDEIFGQPDKIFIDKSWLKFA